MCSPVWLDLLIKLELSQEAAIHFRISSESVNGIGWEQARNCTRQDWTWRWTFVDCYFIFGLLLDKIKLRSMMVCNKHVLDKSACM